MLSTTQVHGRWHSWAMAVGSLSAGPRYIYSIIGDRQVWKGWKALNSRLPSRCVAWELTVSARHRSVLWAPCISCVTKAALYLDSIELPAWHPAIIHIGGTHPSMEGDTCMLQLCMACPVSVILEWNRTPCIINYNYVIKFACSQVSTRFIIIMRSRGYVGKASLLLRHSQLSQVANSSMLMPWI